MDPSPQRVRTGSRPARPRNLAAGCLGLLVVAAALALCGRAVGEIDEADPAPTVEAPASE